MTLISSSYILQQSSLKTKRKGKHLLNTIEIKQKPRRHS